MLKLEEKMETFSKQVDDIISTSHEGMPEWAKLMVTCFKGILKELKVFCEHSVRSPSLETIPELQSVTSTHHPTIGVNGCRHISELRHDVDNLLTESKRLECEISKVRNKIENQELRRRNYDLLLYKMDEPTKKRFDEIIKVIHTDIKGKIPESISSNQRSTPSKRDHNLSAEETRFTEVRQKMLQKSVNEVENDHNLIRPDRGMRPRRPLAIKELITDDVEPIVFYNEDNEFPYKME